MHKNPIETLAKDRESLTKELARVLERHLDKPISIESLSAFVDKVFSKYPFTRMISPDRVCPPPHDAIKEMAEWLIQKYALNAGMSLREQTRLFKVLDWMKEQGFSRHEYRSGG